MSRSARDQRANGLGQRQAWLNGRSTQTTRVSAFPASRGLTANSTDHRSVSDLESALARRQAWIGGLPPASDPSATQSVEVAPSQGADSSSEATVPADRSESPPGSDTTNWWNTDGAREGGGGRDGDGLNGDWAAPSPPKRLKVAQVVRDALTARGIRYRWGGTSRGGFDCSGFTRYLMARNMGIKLPHSAHAQAHYGQKVAFKDLKEGDLVFFHTQRRGISHVGVYVGDNRFIHAPRTGRSVSVESLTGYYRRRFVTARRLAGAGPPG